MQARRTGSHRQAVAAAGVVVLALGLAAVPVGTAPVSAAGPTFRAFALNGFETLSPPAVAADAAGVYQVDGSGFGSLNAAGVSSGTINVRRVLAANAADQSLAMRVIKQASDKSAAPTFTGLVLPVQITSSGFPGCAVGSVGSLTLRDSTKVLASGATDDLISFSGFSTGCVNPRWANAVLAGVTGAPVRAAVTVGPFVHDTNGGTPPATDLANEAGGMATTTTLPTPEHSTTMVATTTVLTTTTKAGSAPVTTLASVPHKPGEPTWWLHGRINWTSVASPFTSSEASKLGLFEITGSSDTNTIVVSRTRPGTNPPVVDVVEWIVEKTAYAGATRGGVARWLYLRVSKSYDPARCIPGSDATPMLIVDSAKLLPTGQTSDRVEGAKTPSHATDCFKFVWTNENRPSSTPTKGGQTNGDGNWIDVVLDLTGQPIVTTPGGGAGTTGGGAATVPSNTGVVVIPGSTTTTSGSSITTTTTSTTKPTTTVKQTTTVLGTKKVVRA